MIGLSDIEDIIRVTVWSGAIEGELPLSIVLIGNPGTGKSSIIKKTYRQPPPPKEIEVPGKKGGVRTIYIRQVSGSVLYTTNTTPYYLYTKFGDLLKKGQIKHIAMPDFLNILNQPKYILSSHITFYNSLIEEGVLAIESRDGQFISEEPVKVGLITAIAKKDYDRKKDDWAAIGFTSRLLPVSYRYSLDTAQKIRDSIKMKDYLQEKSFEIKLPPEKSIYLPRSFADDIEKVAWEVKDPNDEVGARRQKQLQTFCMANAYMNGRDEVTRSDIKKLQGYKKFFNWDCSAEQ